MAYKTSLLAFFCVISMINEISLGLSISQFSLLPKIGIIGDRQIVKCDVHITNPNDLIHFHIFKQSPNPSDLPVEIVKVTQDGVFWGTNVSSEVQSRGQIFGSNQIFPYIELILSHVACADAGDYSCLVAAPGTPVTESHQNLKLNSIPGVPIISLDDSTPKRVGQEINVTCRGLAGQPAGPFLWLRSRNNTNGFVEFTPSLPSKITNLAPIYDASNCQNTRTSVLTYVIEKEDQGLIFKCKVSSTLESVPTTHEATAHVDTSGIISIVTTTPMIPAFTQDIKTGQTSSHSDACFNDFFGMYTEQKKRFIYCRGLSSKENSFRLAKYIDGKRQDIVEVFNDWQFAWHDHSVEARTTLLKIEDRNPGILLRFDKPQCDDNAIYRCEVSQQEDQQTYRQVTQKNYTMYTGDFAANVTVDQPITNPHEVQSSRMPVYVVKTRVLVHLTCTAHVPSLPASIEWHRDRRTPPNTMLWDKNDFGQSAHSVSGCDYEVSNQLPYYVTDGDVGGVDFICTVLSNGVKNSMRVSFTVEGPIVTTTPVPTTIGHQINEGNGIRVTVTPPHPRLHQEMTLRCDDNPVTPKTPYFIRLSKTDVTGTKTVAAVDGSGASNALGGTRLTVNGSLKPNPFLEITLNNLESTDGGTYRCSVGELLQSRFIDTNVTLAT